MSAGDPCRSRRHRRAKSATVRMEHQIGGCVYGIKIQPGDGPMNLPIELKRRLDRRWSARFGVSDQGSRPAPCAAMVSAESRNLERAKSPPPSTAMIDPLSTKTHPKLNAWWSRLRHLP